MKKILTIDDFKAMLAHALVQIREREDEFSQLDAVIGDGDHGTAVVTAFSTAVDAAEKGDDFKAMLNNAGFDIMLQTGGSTSTLLGAFFLGMSDSASGKELDAAGVKALFAGGLANVARQTKATKGDKTMMDALIPAVEAMQTSESTDIATLFSVAAAAAVEGAAATANMKANFGRARNYGDRSIGTIDCGAASWAAMFAAFSDVIK
jgi:dihydroxyacetone kinase-like protein